jgi:hypothetical protein
MKQAFIYSLKVWLTTAVLGMRLAVLIKICLDTDHLIYGFQDVFGSAIYDIPVGIIDCSPSWIIFSFAVWLVAKTKSRMLLKKLCLTSIAIVLGILPFGIVFWYQLTRPNYWPDMAPEILGYVGITIAGIWFYKLRAAANKPLNEPTL